MIRHFDTPEDFFTYVGAKGPSYERLHLKYPNSDPPIGWWIYPVAVAADDSWVAVLDFGLVGDFEGTPGDSRWPEEGSTRISGWGT